MKPIAYPNSVCLISKVLFVMILLIGTNVTSQETIAIQTTMDTSLSLPSDPSDALSSNSMDFSGRFIMQGNQQEHGYMIIFPELIYKSTGGNMKRWSVNVGYVYNKIFIPKSEIGFTLSYGWVDHYAKTSRSLGISSHYAYKISQRIKLVTVLDFTERKDIDYVYPDKDNQNFIPSLRYGLEICLL